MANTFVEKVIGKGEIPIRKMPGFRAPTEEESEVMKNKINKNIKKSIAGSGLWIIVCVVLTVIYVCMCLRAEEEQRRYFVVTAVVFAAMALVSAYKIYADLHLKKIIEEESYRLCEVKVHHMMPAVIAASTTKVKDEKGQVYSYEFRLSRKLHKMYKKDENTVFHVLEVDAKKEKYYITHIEQAE